MDLPRPRLLAACAALLAAACSDGPRPPEPPQVVQLPDLPIARCTVARAPVEIDRGLGRFEDVLVGEELRSGDKLRSRGLGFARVDLASGGGLRLTGDAELELRALARTGAGRAVATVSVARGAVQGFLEPPAPGSSTRPRLFVAVGAAAPGPLAVEQRGDAPLVFAATLAGDHVAVSGVKGQGAVFLSGEEQPLRPGESVEAVGGDLLPPHALPAAPEPIGPAAGERFLCPGLTVRLSWRPAADARATLLEVALEDDFESPVLRAVGAGDHLPFVPRAPGRYLWRVASRDEAGRTGPFSEPRPLSCEALAPRDLLLAPPAGAVVRFFGQTPKLSFSWEASPGARSFRLVVARGSDLAAAPVLSTVVAGATLETDALQEGEYVWGVWALGARADQPLFTAPRRLVLSRSRVKTTTTLQWER